MKFKIDIQFIITLLHLPHVTRKTAHRLLQNLDENIYSMGDLIEYIANDGDTRLMSFLSVSDFETALQKAKKILQHSAANNIKIISFLDTSYPSLLSQIPDCPIVLNYKGNIDALNQMPTIAIIGTRNCSTFGFEYSKHLGNFFAQNHFNVVSGLAKGCDTAAHLGALDANGATSAILAHGLDQVYPRENQMLADRICENGVLISEYFIGEAPRAKHFIKRDRIQAGLSLCVFVVEAYIKGGTMHTVDHCLKYDRILACMKPPYEFYSQTKVAGNKKLVREGKANALYSDDELKQFVYFIKTNT